MQPSGIRKRGQVLPGVTAGWRLDSRRIFAGDSTCSLQQGHTLGCSCFLTTNRPYAFPRLGLQTNLIGGQVQDISDSLLHRGFEGTEFRLLEMHDAIQIEDGESFFFHQFPRVVQHFGRVAISIGGVLIWEQLTNIRQAGGAE